MTVDYDDLPSCIGLPLADPPNRCDSCQYYRLCEKLRQDEILARLTALKAEIRRMRKELRQRGG